jgi:hypothetical protein
MSRSWKWLYVMRERGDFPILSPLQYRVRVWNFSVSPEYQSVNTKRPRDYFEKPRSQSLLTRWKDLTKQPTNRKSQFHILSWRAQNTSLYQPVLPSLMQSRSVLQRHQTHVFWFKNSVSLVFIYNLPLTNLILTLGPTPDSCPVSTGGSFPGIKWLKLEADH